MDRRRTCELMLLVGVLGWAGCNSSASESSYELVEAPKTAPAAAPAVNPSAEDKPVAEPASPEVAKSSEPPAASPDASTSQVEQAAASSETLSVEERIAAMRREALKVGAPGLEPLAPPPDTLRNLIPNKIELKVPHKDFNREGKDRALRVSYDDIDLLRILNMEPVPLNAEEYLPDWLKALNGEKVVLRGWMFPPLMTEGLPAFLFVRDNQICCFGREAKVYDKVRVTLKEGTTTDYIFGRSFDVIGTFHIEAEERDGELYFLYSIDDAVVKK
jgi:hypothetical protein